MLGVIVRCYVCDVLFTYGTLAGRVIEVKKITYGTLAGRVIEVKKIKTREIHFFPSRDDY
jgi:hypothetical protein